MPIFGIEQPETVNIDNTLRLRKYDGNYVFALPWYQDEETVYLVDSTRTPYPLDRIGKMYRYLNDRGELYFIEAKENGRFRPIGDVTFWEDDMPIVIGDPSYRGKGIGKKVISALIQRAKSLGYKQIQVDCIYDYNTTSRKCFTRMGFHPIEANGMGHRYHLDLQ